MMNLRERSFSCKYTEIMDEGKVRDIVIEAADALFYGRGIQSVGMDEVRKASGVSLTGLYRLFSSKESIVLAVLEYRHRLWTDGVKEAVDRAASPRDRLLAVYDYLAEWFATDSFRGCGFINAFGELGAVSPAVAEVARLHKHSFQEYLSRLVADADGTAELAAQLAILAEGAQTTAAISNTTEPASQARRAAETLIASLDSK